MTQPSSPPTTAPQQAPGTPAAETAAGAAAAARDVVARAPEFAPLHPTNPGPALGGLDHLLNVTVSITAELGKATRPIGEVLKYGVGSIVELGRNISEPVELLVQGVRIARGEVVVVDDRFAVRITEITDAKEALTR